MFHPVRAAFQEQCRENRGTQNVWILRKYSQSLEPVFDRIAAGYPEKLTVTGLAEIAKMSVCYFCRVFKNVTGVTPTRYIGEYRANRAEILLLTTGLPLSEIAQATGFGDECYFSRRFSDIKGVPPSEVRRAGQNNPNNRQSESLTS